MTDAPAGIAPPPSPRAATIAVSTQTFITCIGYFVGKDALHGLPPGPFVLLRALGAAVVLIAIVLALRGRSPMAPAKGDLWRLVALGALGVPLNQFLFLWGLSKTTAAHAGLLYSLTPAVVLLFGVARGAERFTRARVAGIVLAILGVVLVLADAKFHAPIVATHDATAGVVARQKAANPLAGDLLILCAVFCWAGYTAFSRGVVSRIGALRATAGALSFGALLYLPIGVAIWWTTGFSIATVPASAWFGLGWFIVMSSVIAYMLWYYAIRGLDPSRVAVFNNLQPVGTALGQWAVFGIPLGPAFLAGGACAVAGVVLAQRTSGRA